MKKKYHAYWTVSEVKDMEIDAEDVEEAKKKWDDLGFDGELFLIVDEETDAHTYFD